MKIKKSIQLFLLCSLLSLVLLGCDTNKESTEASNINMEDVFDTETNERKWENYTEQTFETEILKLENIKDVSIDLTFDANQKATSANVHLDITGNDTEKIEQMVIDYLIESLNIDTDMIILESTVVE